MCSELCLSTPNEKQDSRNVEFFKHLSLFVLSFFLKKKRNEKETPSPIKLSTVANHWGFITDFFGYAQVSIVQLHKLIKDVYISLKQSSAYGI